MRRNFWRIICSVLLIIISVNSVYAADLSGVYISSQGACVMDFNTGEIYYEFNGNIPRVPASMTKIAAMYCIYEAIRDGEISLDSKVPISKNTYDFSRNLNYQSVQPFDYNEYYTVDEMIDVIVVYSANAAVVALAELICGSESAFVERMNRKVGELGIDAWFADSYGGSPLNRISPVAMAILARNIILSYPDILVRSSKPYVYFKGKKYYSTNTLLTTYPGADGLKTGTTSAAGACFCGTAVQNGSRIIAVTMHSASNNQRFVDAANMLDYGFNIVASKINKILFTNIRTYVNETEIPTFYYNGDEPHSVIIADDLVNYGFDTQWVEEERRLYITYNNEKEIASYDMEYYHNKNNQLALTPVESDIAVAIYRDGMVYEIPDVYITQEGYTCISVDDLHYAYEFKWDAENNSAQIFTETAVEIQ